MSYLYAPYPYAPSTCTSTCTHMHLPQTPSTCTSTYTLHRHPPQAPPQTPPHAPPQTPSTDTLHMHPTPPPAYLMQGRFWAPRGGRVVLTVAFDQNWGCACWMRGGVLNTCFYVYNRHHQTMFFTTYSLKKEEKELLGESGARCPLPCAAFCRKIQGSVKVQRLGKPLLPTGTLVC